MTENSPQYDRLRFVCLHLIPEHGQVHIQPLIDISGRPLLHAGDTNAIILNDALADFTVVKPGRRPLSPEVTWISPLPSGYICHDPSPG